MVEVLQLRNKILPKFKKGREQESGLMLTGPKPSKTFINL
jgi:hypothetical protein